jgi:hypothetical protein
MQSPVTPSTVPRFFLRDTDLKDKYVRDAVHRTTSQSSPNEKYVGSRRNKRFYRNLLSDVIC